MKRSARVAVILLFLSACIGGGRILQAGDDDPLAPWSALAGTDTGSLLITWLGDEAHRYLAGSQERTALPASLPGFYGRLGLFITMMKDGRVRGCYGSFFHDSDDAAAVLRTYLHGALRHDVRNDPLGIEELGETRIILTVTTQPFHAEDIETVDIAHYGVIVLTAGGEQHVFVPAEMKTHEYLRKRLKGVPVQSVQAFRAVTIK